MIIVGIIVVLLAIGLGFLLKKEYTLNRYNPGFVELIHCFTPSIVLAVVGIVILVIGICTK